jgi:trehalose/maltose transport system substrate-binding protein
LDKLEPSNKECPRGYLDASPPVPLSINQSLTIKQRLGYYGDRDSNETGKRFDEELSRRFRIDTGIEVKVVNPIEEERLDPIKQKLEQQSSEFDVILIDMIWVGELADHLIDLTPYFDRKEIDEHREEIIANNTVGGKLVAIPWFEDFGLLYYRKDLLNEKWGGPPDTWEELEIIAAEIQQDQISKGRHEFIGFAWQGAAYEGLTCNALEWIASRGGYNMATNHISDRQKVVEAVDQARVWYKGFQGSKSISRGVRDDYEDHSLGVFIKGDAAFLRMWSSGYAKLKQANVSFDVAPLPAKDGQHVSMIGGWQLAVPKYSRHPHAAAEFIRYLTSPEVQTWRALKGTYLPTIKTVAGKLEKQKQLSSLYNAIKKARRIIRPSSRLGDNYNDVSGCFQNIVHYALSKNSTQEVENAISTMARDEYCQKFLSQLQ